MKTLALLAALLLLALQAQAEPVPRGADPDVQAEEEDHVAVIAFPGEESSALPEEGVWRSLLCFCRPACVGGERRRGTCTINGIRYALCCR